MPERTFWVEVFLLHAECPQSLKGFIFFMMIPKVTANPACSRPLSVGLRRDIDFSAVRFGTASNRSRTWGIQTAMKTRFPKVYEFLTREKATQEKLQARLRTLEASLEQVRRDRTAYYDEFSGFLDNLSGISARDEIRVEKLDASLRHARDAWGETVARMLIPEEITEYELLELNEEANELRENIQRAEEARDQYQAFTGMATNCQATADDFHRKTMRDFNQRIAGLEQEIQKIRKQLPGLAESS